VNAEHCPSCALATRSQVWDDHSAFRCEGCHGHFVPGPLLQQFLVKHSGVRAHARLLEKALATVPTTRPLTCPHCRTQSYRALQMGVVEIDVCDTCGGVFLDQGEALLYFRQVRERLTPGKVVDKTVEGFDDAGVVVQLAHFISTMLH
jgi:Zn-finger nucleic acid-binding protein